MVAVAFPIAGLTLSCHYSTMYDKLGSYYYPNPDDPRGRVYVRQGENGMEFRLWHADYSMVWEKHGWLSQTISEQAAATYQEIGSGSNPLTLYDFFVAKALIQEEQRRKESAGHVQTLA